ncbi:MAG: addiction module protein [Planctomycetes bacterium]|nr:addiction module protein [Planctomycetota bacterium]
MPSTKEIIEHLESLPVEGRARIVDQLLRTLNPPDSEMDQAWAAEAQRRLNDLQSGNVQGLPADEVFAKARERFEK